MIFKFSDKQIEELRMLAEQEYGHSIEFSEAREMANNLCLLYETVANIVQENPKLQDQIQKSNMNYEDNFLK